MSNSSCSSSAISSNTSGRLAASLRSSSFTKPCPIQLFRQRSPQVVPADNRLRTWDSISRPLLNSRSTSIDVAESKEIRNPLIIQENGTYQECRDSREPSGRGTDKELSSQPTTKVDQESAPPVLIDNVSAHLPMLPSMVPKEQAKRQKCCQT